MSFQVPLINRTPFTADKFVLPDGEGQEVVLVVLAASFEPQPSSAALSLAAQQCSLELADVHRGPPALTSVQRESDIALVKPAVDVLLEACAYAPGGRPVTSVQVDLAVGDVRKTLLVSGDRHWRRGSLRSAGSAPRTFTRMPIVYERAFGGMTDEHAETRNLCGVGFRGAPCRAPGIATELPNVEYPDDRQSTDADRPRPAGFGVVSRAWQPRLAWAGTYDAEWLAERWPLLPADFDPRHYQAAPADQQSSTLRGGEPVALRNLTPEGLWRFVLPRLLVPGWLRFDDRVAPLPLRMDTVWIQAECKRVTLFARGLWRTRRSQPRLREIVLGHLTPACVRAHASRKHFLDLAGEDGVARTHGPWWV
jgi:hypothetical protein